MSGSVSEREAKVLGIIETARAKRGKFRDERITMAHGAGGKATQALIEGLLAPAFGMTDWPDAARRFEGFAMTTDAFVVTPLRFPGGSIGELAVNGTVNDLAMAGARPLALTLSLVLEEGLPAETLRAEVEAIARAARGGVAIVAGDPRSSSAATRRHVLCTTGLGAGRRARALSPAGLRPGDRILLSGRVATTAPRSCSRAASSSSAPTIESDTCSLWPAVDPLLDAAGPALRCLRDATRGGVASVLNELARASGVAIVVREADVPGAPGRRGRRGAPRHRPDVRRQRGQAGGVRGARGGGCGAGRTACRAGRRGCRADR